MFRTALVTGTAALGLAFGATPAEAHPPAVRVPVVTAYYPPPVPVCRTWKVLYRTCDHEPWRVYRVYHDDDGAYRTARHLRRTGYEARVVFDRGPIY
jgi:hypothetical protein